MKICHLSLIVLISSTIFACSSTAPPNDISLGDNTVAVTAVNVVGDPGSYSFSVTVTSPDTGCEQYADWWEVFRPDGTLVYRRILAHSHVNEQPFTRSGGPVTVAADEEIMVRAHMNNSGYNTQFFRGSVSQGFIAEIHDSVLATELALAEPLPDDCAF